MTSLIVAMVLMIVIVGPLIAWAFREDRRRRRAALDENEGVA